MGGGGLARLDLGHAHFEPQVRPLHVSLPSGNVNDGKSLFAVKWLCDVLTIVLVRPC